MLLATERRGRFFTVSASIALAFLVLLTVASRAQSGELVYWDNYSTVPQSISVANIDGSGGGALNLAGINLKDPEGMTFDSLAGRLYVASSSGGVKGEIVYVNVDGTGAGVLNTAGAEVSEPYGVAIDPATRTIYWANNSGGPEGKGSIGFARLDGSGGGLLNTAGVTVEKPYKLAVDPVSGRVFWANTKATPYTIAFANLNNTGGGGTLDITGSPAISSIYAIAVDSGAGRVYWLDSTSGNEHLSFASVHGGGGGEVSLAGSVFKGAYGLAIDSSLGRIYWANCGQNEVRTGAIGFVNLAGGGGGITPATAPVNCAQDPVILKSPTATAAPVVTRSATSRSQLACSQASWAADAPGAFVYQAPRTIGYQWTYKGVPIAGATAPTLNARKPGSYACLGTASNQAGTGSQTSVAVDVKAAKLKLTTRKKANADTGDLVKFKVKAVNQGDLKAKSAKLCVKLPKAAKDDLKAPKCKKLGQLKSRAKKTVTIKIKVKGSADEGTDKLTFQVKGAPGKAAKSKIIVK